MHVHILLLMFIVTQGTDSPVDSIAVKIRKPTTVNLSIQQIHDPWVSNDKFLHFSACAATCGLTFHFYANRLNRDEKRGKIYAVSLTALFGIGKEIYDKKKKGIFSWKDLVWDGFGLAAGYFIFVH